VVAGLARGLVAALRLPPAPAERLFADGVRDALAAHVCARYCPRPAPAPAPARPLSRPELARVDDLLDIELTAQLRVADLAAVVPMSPSQFSRAFRATTGLSPHAYLVRRRVGAARKLLTRAPFGLDEIARRTGFSDGSHLARQFRRHLGTSPSAFRRTARP